MMAAAPGLSPGSGEPRRDTPLRMSCGQDQDFGQVV